MRTVRRHRWWLGGTVPLLVAAALALGEPSVADPPGPGTGPTTTALLTPPPTPTPSDPARMILTGPDAPDPFILVAPGGYYLYASEGNSPLNIPLYTGTTIGNWGPVTDALPTLPAWALRGFTWAPDVRQVTGGWALFFTGVLKGVDPTMECIGAAYGTDRGGPFVADPKPFVCQRDHRGSIDPRTFQDEGGRVWLDWKSDDNADPNTPGPDQNGMTGIWAQQLSPDGRSLLGTPTRIFQPDQPWEGTIVESPDMVDVAGIYWLFFSANWFNQPDYAIGVARCAGPTGPCADGPDPLLTSNDQGQGPGEPAVFSDGQGIWLLYNPWKSNVPHATPPRPVAMVRLGFSPAGPYLAAP